MDFSNFNYEEALGYLIKRTGRTMGRALRHKFAAQGMDMPIEHWGILVHLWHKDGQNQKDLAENVFKDKATITRAVVMLEKLDIVRRVSDEVDKRQNLVYLTERGKALRTTMVPLAMEVKKKATDGISQTDIDTCKQVLKKIYENLNQSFQ